MNVNFESDVFVEYRKLRESLNKNSEVLTLVEKRNELINTLRELDQYTSKYSEVKDEYEEVAYKLQANEEYKLFKELEREINLFVMHCNSELKKLFDLDEKGC